MEEEQRRHARVPVDTPVRFHVIDAAGRPTYELKSGVNRDASIGGVRLFLDEPVAVGTRLELEILLPVKQGSMVRRHVFVRGQVVRLENQPEDGHPYAVGVSFTAYDEEDAGLLEAYLRALENQAEDQEEEGNP